jgi:MFS family permease
MTGPTRAPSARGPARTDGRRRSGGSRPGAAPVAAALATMALGIVAIVLDLIPDRPGVAAPPGTSIAGLLIAVFVIATPALGALLAVRRPEDRTGWLFIAMTFFMVLSFLADGIARHVEPTPAIAAFAVLADALGSFAFAILFVVFQIFPTGRVLPGWRWLPVTVLAATTTQVVTVVLEPASFTPPIPDLVNPLARPEWQPVLDAVGAAVGIALLVAAVGTLVELVLRFRRSRGIERQQIKWFAWAAVLVVSLIAASLITNPWGPVSNAFWMLANASLVLLPVAATAAILRYRLWDIDRLVSRTIAWTVVTALLAAVFAGLVVGLQQLLAPITGATTIVVAGSTLVVFALFQPLRRRVQHVVDRRFDRARYDAERTVATLTARLRDETDLQQVGQEIEAAVRDALAPSLVVVWTRDR